MVDLVKHKFLFTPFFVLCFVAKGISQTIPAPDLQCVQNNSTNGDITLYWTNPPLNACGAFVQYTIYASSNGIGGPYTQVAVTSSTTQSFTLAGYLNTSPYWWFYMEANYNCPGFTSLQSDTLDNLNPVTPDIVSVDVIPNNDVVFIWEPGTSPETHCYILYYYLVNGNAVPFDTVCGINNTVTIDAVANPDSGVLAYTVAAVDSCGSISAFNTSPHYTIYLTAGSSACERRVNLNWTKYINWPLGVQEYRILVSKNNGPYDVVGSVDSSMIMFNYTGFNDGDSLCVIVRAISAADTNIVSNSNKLCLKASLVQPPAYNYITNATVGLDNHISITWLIDVMGELTFYKVERSSNNVSYTNILQFSAPSPLNAFETHIDSTGIQPEKNPYFYKVTAFDSCQSQHPSPYVKTVNLRGELYDYYIANLEWNDYELYGATVTQYKLYRNYGSGYQLLRVFPFGVNSYSDSLQQFLSERGIFCYRIEAVYDLNLPDANYSATLSSWSNEVCIIHRPIIYIPTAFHPESPVAVNAAFKPTMIFNTAPKGYTLQIYNRWGARIFESNNPDVGWDGTDHGKEAQQGGYAYLIQFYAEDGVKVERKGMVLLVR